MVADQSIDPGYALEQPFQLWWASNDNTPTEPGDDGRISDELDTVAQTLFAVNEDRPAIQIRSIPKRLGKVSL